MKTIIVICTVVAVAVAVPADTYNPAYDNFDVTEVVDNPRVLKNYAKCFLEQGPCTSEGLDFRKKMPEALRTSCAKCTPKQRQYVRIIARAFQTKQPQLWNELVDKLDPKREYTESFETFLGGTD